MIHVNVLKNGNDYVTMTVTGHAQSGEPGFDLVCAAVSSIMIGGLNGFDSFDCDTELTLTEEPLIKIHVNKINKLNQILFQFLLTQLRTVKDSQREYIEINEKEETS